MTTRKVENPNKKGNAAFIWAVLAVLAIALLVIGLIVYNGRENRNAAMQEEMIDATGINVAWNEDEDIIHLTGSNKDAKTAELFEDFSCTHCADLHIATDEAMLEKLKAGEINVDLRPMTALDQGQEGHSTKALAAELALTQSTEAALTVSFRYLAIFGIAAVLAEPLEFGRIRYSVTAGPGPLGSDRGDAEPTYIVLAAEQPHPPASAGVALVPWTRNERSAVAGLKTTSYAENVVALRRAQELGDPVDAEPVGDRTQ